MTTDTLREAAERLVPYEKRTRGMVNSVARMDGIEDCIDNLAASIAAATPTQESAATRLEDVMVEGEIRGLVNALRGLTGLDVLGREMAIARAWPLGRGGNR